MEIPLEGGPVVQKILFAGFPDIAPVQAELFVIISGRPEFQVEEFMTRLEAPSTRG
jgi:hypothetical protein